MSDKELKYWLLLRETELWDILHGSCSSRQLVANRRWSTMGTKWFATSTSFFPHECSPRYLLSQLLLFSQSPLILFPIKRLNLTILCEKPWLYHHLVYVIWLTLSTSLYSQDLERHCHISLINIHWWVNKFLFLKA